MLENARFKQIESFCFCGRCRSWNEALYRCGALCIMSIRHFLVLSWQWVGAMLLFMSSPLLYLASEETRESYGLCFCISLSLTLYPSVPFSFSLFLSHSAPSDTYKKFLVDIPANIETFCVPPFILGILTGLCPFHSYKVTLTACSQSGCTESSQALSISTPQEGKVISKVLTSTFQSWIIK